MLTLHLNCSLMTLLSRILYSTSTGFFNPLSVFSFSWPTLILLSHFQTWPAGEVRRTGSRLYPDFAVHACSMQREVFYTDAFTTATNPLHYSGNRWSSLVQQTEAESKVLTPLRRSRDHVYSKHPDTLVSAYHHKLSWHLCWYLLCVCHCVFNGRYLFSFSFFIFVYVAHHQPLLVNLTRNPHCVLTLDSPEF